MAEIFAYSAIFLYLCTRKMGFRSSVGLEQRPSKAWVYGSNPYGITSKNPQEAVIAACGFLHNQ